MLLLFKNASFCIRKLLKVDDMLVAGPDMAKFNKPKWVLIFVEDSWNEEPCSDVHQVGDKREVEVLRSFKWPPSELIMDNGVLPERGYFQFNDVSLGYLVSSPSPVFVQDTLYRKSPSLAFGWCNVFRTRLYRKVRAIALLKGKCLAWGVQFGMGRAVWHEPEQFSSELNNISLV
nr:hypothetical protein [Tanacetum cinerariifolium]